MVRPEREACVTGGGGGEGAGAVGEPDGEKDRI